MNFYQLFGKCSILTPDIRKQVPQGSNLLRITLKGILRISNEQSQDKLGFPKTMYGWPQGLDFLTQLAKKIKWNKKLLCFKK